MPTVPVYNQDGQQTGELELASAVFGVRPKAAVLHQVIVAHAANRRQAIAHTKTRGEVSGGGKKPWAQKGTGRARHGSIRSPIWVGGGIVFGPRRERTYAQKVNIEMRRQALRMALSDKVAGKRFVVLEDFASADGKTKAAKRILEAIAAKAESLRRRPAILIALPATRRAEGRSFRNLSRVRGMDVVHLNAFDVVRHDILVTTRDGVAQAAALFAPRREPKTGSEKPTE